MCPIYINNLFRNVCTSIHRCNVWDCLHKQSDETHLKEDEEQDIEVLRFWVPQRSFSTQSVQSLTPSLKSLKRDSVTSVSTIAEDETSRSPQRRHSDNTRPHCVGISHEWPQRVHHLSGNDYFLEKTSSVSSIKLSLYKDIVSNDNANIIFEESSDSSTANNSKYLVEDQILTFGNILFTINYDHKKKRLNLYLDKASDLPQRGRKRTYDTLIKISLMSKQNDNNSRKSFSSKDTTVLMQNSRKIKNTLDPHFHENFIFEIEKLELLHNLLLCLSLYDYERQERFDAIGHVVLTLNCMTKANETFKYNLPFRSYTIPEYNANGPQLLVSLGYSSTSDRLSVGILRSKRLLTKESSLFESLFKMNTNSTAETYVKVTLLCASKKIKSLKTNIVLAETNSDPVFNQTFNFVAPHGFIDDISVVISVCLKSKLKFDRVIGRVISGPIAFASNDKLTHWGKMIFGSERAITQWRNVYL